MKNIFNYNVPKYACDKVEHAYTNYVADVIPMRIATGLITGVAAGALIAGGLYDETPVTYELDAAEITADVRAEYEEDIDALATIKSEIDALDRASYIAAYDSPDDAADIQMELEIKSAEFNARQSLLIDRLYTDPDMTETAFIEFENTMISGGLAHESQDDPLGLKECQSQFQSVSPLSERANDVQVCMAESNPEFKKQMNSEYQVLGGMMGLIGGWGLAMVLGVAGMPHRRKWIWEHSPKLSDYKLKKKPKVGNN